MSAEAEAYAERYSPYRGATFRVHMGIARIVNEAHEHLFWLAQSRFAKMLRLNRRSVYRALEDLQHDGFVELVERRNHDIAVFRFLYPEDRIPVWDSKPPRVAVGQSVPQPRDTMSHGRETPCPTPGTSRPTRGSERSKIDPKGNGTRRWRVCPPDQQLTEDRIRIAQESGLSRSRAERQWLRFKNHEYTTPKSDVDRTWQNWCLKEADYGGVDAPPSPVADLDRQRRHQQSTAAYQARLASSAARRDEERRQADRARQAERRPPSEPTPLADTLKNLRVLHKAMDDAGL